MVDRFNKYGFRGSIHIVQLMCAGVFDRFPKLALYIAEVQVGWIPNWVDQLENEYGRQKYWVERLLGLPQLKRLPGEYVREHCYWGFNRNPGGVRVMRQEMGVDRIMWANDFPHLESDWPNSRRVIEESFAGVSEREIYQMIAGNASRFFHLEEA
jgi:predicted TIM-barrel fold metal-dependent hydrolase